MAVIAIPETAVEQPSQTQALDASGGKTFSRSFKDRYDALKAAADAIATGDTLDGLFVRGYSLSRAPAGLGVLTVSLSPESSDDETQSASAQKAVWSCKSVRNDVSILAYCGESASRVALELWMKETDKELADAYSFHRNDSETDSLNSQEQAIAAKIGKGVESVIRFYPVLTCTSYWTRIPGSFMQRLGFIDTPSAPAAETTHAPGNLASIISSHSWLKVQDDVAETGDGRFQRIESWMGIANSDTANGWDPDLYGSSRWKMPL